MKTGVTLLTLLAAAVLEAGGDALVRAGLHSGRPAFRFLFLVAGALVLFSYGYAVNAPGWDFGRLLGIYVVFFFIVAQVISWLVFGQRPGAPIFIGGALIVIGGFVIAGWPE